ncbi:MAG: GEVED domain-containing protein [Bacteroidota bacterium]
MKRIYYAIALLALIGFSGFARAQTPETNNNPDAPLAYCAANASFNVQFISSVKVGSIYNITKWSAAGYGDYTSLWTAMTVGTGYAITINNGFGYSTDQCAIWVDWNKDQDFTDAGEQITVSGTPGLGPYTATITPPTGTAAGTTRMRVRISGQGSFTSCGTTMYGETEDYTVNIGGTPSTTDIGVVDLLTPVTGTTVGSTETVKVRIYNFGTVAQSNFPVSYLVNSGTLVTETVTATVAPGVTYDYTFTQKANMSTLGATYTVQTYTNLTGDQNSANDGVTRTIFHAWAQNQKVVQGEYFINTDPGVGNGIAITGTYNLVDVTVNITNLNLPVGSRLYVRFKSQNGKWSFPRSFKRESYLSNLNATLTGCEYFVNTDPGQGNGTTATITSGTANIANLNVPVGSRVYVRVKDSFGRWSKPMGIKRNAWFSNQNATLTYAEYFLNTDPGQGNGTSVSVTSVIINLTNLNQPVGTKIYVRVKDSFNRWSQPMGITRQGWYSIQGSTLTYAEYFINTDPGNGNGTPLSITGGNVTIPNLNTPVGSKVYIRGKDN